jgi:N-acetylglucosamine-6-phosphate deacetylase
MSLPMPIAIRCPTILTADSAITPGTLLLGDDGRIADCGSSLDLPAGAEVVDLPDATLVPGFIDLHVHGGGGFSLATRDVEEIRNYARWVVSHGVTSFLPTICAGSIDEGLEFTRTAAEAIGAVEGGANVLGVNLEGPFVNPDRRGALPQGWPAEPSEDLVDQLIDAATGRLRVVTLAPEVQGVEELIGGLTKRGVVVSIGHSDADYETAAFAFREGARHVTHLFNAMRPFHHRDVGIVGAAFEARDVIVELIADGVHLDKLTVEMVVRMFGPGSVALVTDGVPPAGVDDGSFHLGNNEARLVGKQVLLPDGTIAGSAATMSGLVRNVIDWGIAEPAAAVRMAASVPARVLGLGERKGRIGPGYDADLVVLDRDLQVVMTWVQGQLVYSR